MRILHVITSLRTGGAEKLMVDLLPRLRDLGHEVELVVFDGVRTPFFEDLEKKGISIHTLRIGGSVYHPGNLFKLIPYLRRFDCIHTHNTAPQLFAALSHLFARKCKLVTTEHNTTNRRRDMKGMVYIDRWMYRQYRKVICISDQAEENLRRYLKDDSGKICTIYNGVDIRKYQNAQPIEEIRKQYEGCKLGIMVSAFRAQKDQKTLIQAYKELPDNYHLLLAGTGDLEDECKELVQSLGLAQRIHFLGMRTDVPQLLHTADVVVLSSHYEGLSLSSIEGMACGNPFIATDVDGLREIVSGSGVLVPHEDAKTLAGEIKKLSENAEYREKILTLCQEKAKMYDIATMAEKYNNIYKQL